MDNPHMAQRIKQIQKHIKQKKIGCLLLLDPANVTYATGFMGHDSWAAVTPHQVYLLTDSRYTEQAEKDCTHCGILERSGSMSQLVAGLCKRLRNLKTLHIEDTVTCGALSAIKKAVPVSVKTTSSIEGLRSVKDPWEYKLTCRAVHMAISAFNQTVPEIQAGIREFEVAALLDYHIHRQGARNAFDTIVAFGPNGSRPHHQPSTRRIKSNDTILMDFGARTQGYCSDITRSFSVGRAPRLFDKVYRTVQRAQQTAIAAMGPGIKVSDVDQAARRIIAESGLPVYGHGTGHGIGLDIHEAPALNPNASDTMKPGQIITVEPGIYMPGKLGIRLEDYVMITDKGPQVLTQACKHFQRLEDYSC
jgi:Xaa-Pro aminopeptidase